MKAAEIKLKLESLYSDLIGRAMNGFALLTDNSSHPKLVAKVILDAINSIEPEIRYVVGDCGVHNEG
jgi:hypothetical protein